MNQAPDLYSTSLAWHSCAYKTIFSFFIASFIFLNGFAQDTSINKEIKNRREFALILQNDGREVTTPLLTNFYPYNKKKVKLIAAANVVGYSGFMVGLYAAWYKNYPQSKFHTFNDFPEWKQIDKMGHAYSAYAEGKASMELWRWTGISRKERIWIGGLSGAVYQTVIEVLDGFSSEWGWSWGDIGANLVGSALLVSQELAWDEQRIQFKWSFHRKRYDDPSLNARSDEIFGKSNPERFLKDYNGQTYWLSTNLRSFFPHSKIPQWLNVSIGTGAEGMFGATENIGKDKDGNIEFNRTDIKRYRQWYIAPDIDLTKIKTNKKAIRMALMILNILKFPTPSLEYSKGGVKFNWIHF
ncbi:MAG: DUF2279 domain-containing protein [Ferruginibacter sp.]